MPLDVAAYRTQFLETYGERLRPISPALVDLYLMVADNEGIRISELKELSGVSRDTLNRMLRVMGPVYEVLEGGRRFKVGYGLLLLRVSLENRREREVVLSARGKQIFKELRVRLEPQ